MLGNFSSQLSFPGPTGSKPCIIGFQSEFQIGFEAMYFLTLQVTVGNQYVRVVLNSFTRKRTSSPNKKFSFAKLSPYPCLTLAVHQASIEQDLGQMSHRNFSVVAAHSDSMFLHSILVLAHLHRPVLTLPRPNCSTHLLQRSLSKPTV